MSRTDMPGPRGDDTLGTPGSTEADAGISPEPSPGKSIGEGAFYQNAIWEPGVVVTAKGAVFDANGSISFKLKAKFAARPSAGTLSYNGKATVMGGTGAFKDVYGTLKVSGITLTSDPDAATFNLNGTLT